MSRRVLRVVALTAASLLAITAGAGAGPREARSAQRGSHRVVQTYQGGLNFPVDMAWVRGTKKIFFTQKNGKIRVMVGRTLKKRACATLNVNAVNERGLLGIALGPHFKRSHHLYVYYTHASPLQNRVARFTVGNNRCRNKTDVVTGISASSSGYHNGGQIEFVRGKMYVSVGEAHSAGNAQVKTNRLGKILRYRPDGSIPRGNPFRKNGHRNPVWTYGHRNPFGLTHVPGTTRILETENGPECDDEVNRIVKGRNYGWGDNYQCGTAGVGSNPKRPMTRYNPTIAPTDAIFYRGRLRAWRNDLFFGDFNNHHLHRLVLGSHQSRVVRQRVIYTAPTGIVDTSIGPGRWLYLLTTNSIMRIARR